MCQVGFFRAVRSVSHCPKIAPGGQEVPDILCLCLRGLSHSSAHAQSILERGIDSGHGSARPGNGDTDRGLGPQGPGGEPPGMSPIPRPGRLLLPWTNKLTISAPALGCFSPSGHCCLGPGAQASLLDPQSPPCEMRWSLFGTP